MNVNLLLLALLAALAAWEILAGLVATGPFAPMTTVSEYVWAFESRHGFAGRAVVAAALAALACHLLAGWPLGPS